MKRIVLWMICLLLTNVIIAQTQQGIVKTKGRMVNGKHVAGHGLSGATVTIQGRSAVLSQANGSFSFPVSSKTFLVQGVQKNGYQLVDADATKKAYQYSANPLYLVMESPEQQRTDLLAAERKIRRNLQRQLEKREEEIDALNASNAVKDSLLRILYQQQGDNEKIIADMAKRHATLDYDQLDEFYRQVNVLIENGELTRADSLLRSRGDVEVQVESQLHRGRVIREQKEKIQKAETVHASSNEELARRCYAYFESFKQQHKVDSAAHYIELCASLDTTNIEWQNIAGQYIKDYIGNDNRAMAYYQSTLRQLLQQYGEESELTAAAYNNIGVIFQSQGDYPKALDVYSKALAIKEKVLGTEHPEVAASYNNIGTVFYSQGDYPKALEYYLKALAIKEKECGTEHLDIATSYNNIGTIYRNQGDYSKALEFHLKALAIREKVLGAEHPVVAQSFNNIGVVYDNQGNYPKALEYYQKASAIREKVLGSEHPDVATSYSNIGTVYYRQGDYPKALEFHFKALTIREKVLGAEHPEVATSYNNIGLVYRNQGDYPKALEYFLKDLAICEKVLGAEHPNVASSYNNIGGIYHSQGDYTKALEAYFKSLAIKEKVFGAEHPSTATSYNNIGVAYHSQGNYPKALEYYQRALAIREKVLGAEHPNTKTIKKNIETVKSNMDTDDGN